MIGSSCWSRYESENFETVFSAPNNDNFGTFFFSKIAALKRELEQAKHEKEQLVLDTELLRIQVARRRQNAGDGTASSTSAGEGVTSPDGTTQNGLKPEELTREALIKEHYQARINQLSAQLHYSDSRAVAFFEECKALALKVQSMRSNRQQQADNLTVARKERLKDLAAASARVSQMEEELATVKRGYEEQVGLEEG